VEHRYTVERRLTLLRTAVERIEALPGFERASFSLGMPLTIRHGRTSGATVGIAGADGTRNVEAYWAENMVGPGYFEALAIPLRQGRGFDDRDATGAPRVVVVNEEFARRHLAGAAAVGMHLLLPGATAPEAWEIVGVAGNGKYRSLGEDQMAALYFPYAQRPGGGRLVHMVARAAHVNDANVAAMTRAIGDLDRTAAVEVRPMEGMLAFAFLPSRVGAGLLGGLGVLGLTLAMAGLFAMLSYSVTRRTREIGVRMALGATGRAVARLVVGDAAVLVAAGLAIGLAAAAFVTKPLASFLVAGLSTSDPVTFASTALLFVLVSAAAAWLPTRRATRVDPVIALRDE
jgi:hypothetical protein